MPLGALLREHSFLQQVHHGLLLLHSGLGFVVQRHLALYQLVQHLRQHGFIRRLVLQQRFQREPPFAALKLMENQ
jgi:hypothetical protein